MSAMMFPIAAVPDEILGEIFFEAVSAHAQREDEFEERKLTIYLTHVVQRWREVMLRSRRFWRRIVYCYSSAEDDEGKLESRLERISTYLERSNGASLDVRIAFHWRPKTDNYFPRMWNRLAPHLGRCVSLKLSINMLHITRPLFLDADLSCVRIFHCDLPSPPRENDASGPNLRHRQCPIHKRKPLMLDELMLTSLVHFQHGNLSVGFDANYLKRLDILRWHLVNALPFLQACVSLTHLTIRSEPGENLTPPTQPTLLPSLLTLRLYNAMPQFCFQCITAPNVRNLVLLGGGVRSSGYTFQWGNEGATFSHLRSLYLLNFAELDQVRSNKSFPTRPTWAQTRAVLASNHSITHIRVLDWIPLPSLVWALATNVNSVPELLLLELAGLREEFMQKSPRLGADLKKALEVRHGLRLLLDERDLDAAFVGDLKEAFGERVVTGWHPEIEETRMVTMPYLGLETSLTV